MTDDAAASTRSNESGASGFDFFPGALAINAMCPRLGPPRHTQLVARRFVHAVLEDVRADADVAQGEAGLDQEQGEANRQTDH